MTETLDSTARKSPYQGLRSFAEEDTEFFFGRAEETAVIIVHLKASRLTVLYGPSGVGKTSLLRAGVVAELDRQAAISQKRVGTPEFIPVIFGAWRENPSLGLADAIATAVTRVTGVVMEPEPSLAETIAAAARLADATLLVIFDQFEDLLAAQSAHNGSGGFPAEFPLLIEDKSLPVNVLVSIRADALALLDRFSGAIPWMLETRLSVGPLSDAAAEEAIRGPLDKYNELRWPDAPVSIEDELVSAVLDQVRSGRVGFEQDDRPGGGAPDASTNGHAAGHIETPYLQLVMAAVWDRELGQDFQRLRLDTLKELGGAREIVSTHLDNVLSGLPPGQKEVAYQVFHQLVTPSGTKTVLRVSDLAEYSHRPVPQVQQLVESLESSERRILRAVPPPPGDPGEPGVEIFHDVLAAAILVWRRGETAKRLENEKLEAQALARREEARARRERKRAQIFRALAAATTALLAIAIGLGLYAEHQRAKADHARRIAESGQLGLAALADFQHETLDRGSLLSLEAYRIAPTPQARDDLVYAQEETQAMRAYFGGQAGAVSSIAFAPDGRSFASGRADGTVVLRDVSTGRQLHTLGGQKNFVESVAFSPDGRRLASASADGTVLVWRVATGAPVLRLTSDGRALYGVAFSPNGTLLASAGTGRMITLWNALTGRRVRSLTGAAGTIYGVTFNPAGNLIAAASADHTVRVWAVATGRTVHVLRGHAGAVNGLAFSPDGALLASAGADRSIVLWNVTTGRLARRLPAASGVQAVAFSSDGHTLASGGSDGSVSLWNLATGALTRALHGQTNTVGTVVFSPDGRTVASGSYDGSVILWDLASPASRVLDSGSQVYSVAFSPDGGRLASGTAAGVRVWSLTTGQSAVSPQAGGGVIEGVAFSPDGRTIAGVAQNGWVSVWDSQTGHLRFRRPSGSKTVHAIAFSPSGQTLATAADDGHLFLSNARTGTLLSAPRADGNPLYTVAFSPDGKTVAAAGANATVFVWNVGTGALARTLSAHSALIEGVAFSPDGTTIAAASDDHAVILWNAQTGQPLGDPLRGHLDRVTSVGFRRSGTLLASGSFDGTAIAWNVTTRLGRPLGGHSAPVTSVAFSPIGDTLASASRDGTVDIFDGVSAGTSAQAIDDRLCGVVRRNLTRAEWQQFVPGEPYQRLCAGYL